MVQIALAPPSPIELLMEPLYNPTGGYASYVVPAAFALILQQTLLIGAATLAGLGFEHRGSASRMMPIGPASLLGRGLAHPTVVCAADRAQLPAIVADRNQRKSMWSIWATPVTTTVVLICPLLSRGSGRERGAARL